MARDTNEILLDVVQRLQADQQVRVDLSDIVKELELKILFDQMGDEE